MTMVGADADALDALARQCRTQAEQLHRILTMLNSQIHAARWPGPVGDRFRQDWNRSHARALRAAVDHLQAAGERLVRNAQQQREASAGVASPTRVINGPEAPKWKDTELRPVHDVSTLMPGTIKVTDVAQGYLGDCYFAAAVAALAASPRGQEILRGMFHQNPDGTITVTFADGHTETVDASFYVDANGRPIGGASEAGVANWYSVLEKAYAQRLAGGYDDLNKGGEPAYIFEGLMPPDLCRAPLIVPHGKVSDLEIRVAGAHGGKPSDDVWALLTKAQQESRPAAVSFTGTTLPKSIPADEAHALTVLRTYDEGGRHMVELRNPWGENASYDMKTALTKAGAHMESGGSFAISVEDLTKFITRVEE